MIATIQLIIALISTPHHQPSDGLIQRDVDIVNQRLAAADVPLRVQGRRQDNAAGQSGQGRPRRTGERR